MREITGDSRLPYQDWGELTNAERQRLHLSVKRLCRDAHMSKS